MVSRRRRNSSLHFVDRPGAFPDAGELLFEVGTERRRQFIRPVRARLVQHRVGHVQHRAEQIELVRQYLQRQPLGLVVLRQEVHHRHVAGLAVAMAAPDPLLDALRGSHGRS